MDADSRTPTTRKQMNGIIISGKVFEAVKEGDCQVCDFDRHCKQCMEYGELCHLWDSAFRYSEELTLKLNKR